MDYWKEENIKNYVVDIAKYYQDCSASSFWNMTLPEKLNKEERKVLNEKLKLDEIVGVDKSVVLNEILKNKEKDNFSFYLIRTLEIDLEVNCYNEIKETVFIELAQRYFDSEDWFFPELFNCLFRRGYEIKEEDNKFSLDLYKRIKKQSEFDKWTILRFAVKLNDAVKFDLARKKDRELFTILSYKMGKPIHFNFPNLLGISNNAIQHYRECGDIILKAMDFYKRSSKIEELDKKKGTFKRKKAEYFENKPIQDEEFTELVFELFPELK